MVNIKQILNFVEKQNIGAESAFLAKSYADMCRRVSDKDIKYGEVNPMSPIGFEKDYSGFWPIIMYYTTAKHSQEEMKKKLLEIHEMDPKIFDHIYLKIDVITNKFNNNQMKCYCQYIIIDDKYSNSDETIFDKCSELGIIRRIYHSYHY